VVACVVSIRSYLVGTLVGDNKRIRGMRQRAERLATRKIQLSSTVRTDHTNNPNNNLPVLSQHHTNEKRNKAESIDLILSAKLHLIDIMIPAGALSSKHKDNYQKVRGVFCPLNWAAHKKDPSSAPMFKDLLSQSGPECDPANRIVMDLASIVERAKEYDAKNYGKVHVIQPTGFAFHESRVGSTLVANSMAAVDPERNRVYSESGPPVQALRACDEDGTDSPDVCDYEKSAMLLRDVVYMMGRTNDATEDRLFFKMQSVSVKHLQTSFLKAFPTTPWIFVYRDPVQTMMSHWKGKGRTSHRGAVCMRSYKSPKHLLTSIVHTHLPSKPVSSLSEEEFCAAHLASLCQAAIQAHEATGTGRMVNYADLPNVLIDSIFPNYFGVPVGTEQRQRIETVCGVYSKGRGDKAGVWKDDSALKEQNASPLVKAACDTLLQPSYEALQKLSSSPII